MMGNIYILGLCSKFLNYAADWLSVHSVVNEFKP